MVPPSTYNYILWIWNKNERKLKFHDRDHVYEILVDPSYP